MKCPKHPTYQAKHRPTSNCPVCLEIWRAALSTTGRIGGIVDIPSGEMSDPYDYLAPNKMDEYS